MGRFLHTTEIGQGTTWTGTIVISTNKYFHSEETPEASTDVSVGWDNDEQSVVRITLCSRWSWEALYEANNTLINMMRGKDQTVHLLLDFTDGDTIPSGGVIMHMRNLLGAYPPNCDLRIIVTHNVLVERLMNIFQAAFQTGLGQQVYTVSSVEDAYRLIEKHDRLQAEIR